MLQQPDLIGGTLSILPLATFVMGIIVTIVQLYVTSRLAKIEEKVLLILRAEAKDYHSALMREIEGVEHGMMTQIEKMRGEMVVEKDLRLQIKLLKQEHLNDAQTMLRQVYEEHRKTIQDLLNQNRK